MSLTKIPSLFFSFLFSQPLWNSSFSYSQRNKLFRPGLYKLWDFEWSYIWSLAYPFLSKEFIPISALLLMIVEVPSQSQSPYHTDCWKPLPNQATIHISSLVGRIQLWSLRFLFFKSSLQSNQPISLWFVSQVVEHPMKWFDCNIQEFLVFWNLHKRSVLKGS